MKRVLIACPTYEGMEYCFEKFLDRIKNIDYDNFSIVIFDNSKSKKFFRKIREIPGIKVFHDDIKEEKNMKRLISSRNKIIDYATSKNFDYLLMLDGDVMVPNYVLKTLLNFDKDVISGLYYGDFKRGGEMVNLPVAFSSITQEEFDKLKEKNKLPELAKTKEDMMRHLNAQEINNNSILEVFAPSGGCLLLSRKAFTSGAKYGLGNFPKEIFCTEDIYFFNRLRERGFKLYCSPKVLCEHIFLEKYKLNKGIHPLGKES